MRIVVTGATGFIGSSVVRALRAYAAEVIPVVRWPREPSPQFDGLISVGDIDAATDWTTALRGVDCVIHCAARAHVTKECEDNALATYRQVNVDGTRRLAEQAAIQEVQRIVFLSSIKVHGEETLPGSAFQPLDVPRPVDPYGLSKWEAEQALWDVAAATGIEVVVIRSPLVYGPGVKGNIERLLGLIRRGLPLPVGRVRNRRSMIGLANLVDLLILCIDHPAAANETFLVADGQDLSTPDLVRHLARAMGRSPRLVPVPVSWLFSLGSLTGKADEVRRLVGSLQVDSSRTSELLGWVPPVSVEVGLEATAHAYLELR